MKYFTHVPAGLKNKKVIFLVVFLIFMIVLFVFSNPFTSWIKNVFGLNELIDIAKDYPLSIYVLDVGKADAILICIDDEYFMIDSGTYADGDKVEIALKKLGIEKLSAVFATHPDNDHIGGMAQILREFQCDKLVVPEIPKSVSSDTAEYEYLMKAVEERNVTLEVTEAGEYFALGDANMEILGPIGDHAGANNYSLVMKLTFGEFSMLFTGDMEARAENALCKSEINLEANVLKVAHHGSKTSSTEEFLNRVKPECAVISTGYDRSKLPRKEVLQRLENKNIDVFRTDIDGTLLIAASLTKYEIFTEKPL